MADEIVTSAKSSTENEQERKRLIDLLEFELASIQTAEAKSGWSTRVLLASIASLVWLITIEIEKNQHSWNIALFVFLIALISLGIIRNLEKLLFPSTTLRLDLISQFSGIAIEKSLFEITIWGGMFYVYLQFYTPARSFFSAIIFVNIVSMILVNLIGALAGPLMSVSEIPLVAISRPRSYVNRLPFIFLVIGLVSLIGLIQSLWLGLVAPSPTDVRIGLIIFAIYIIVTLLIEKPTESPLIETLERIRRNLGLGKMETEAARNETEIALIGLSASNALQKSLNALLDLLEAERKVLQSAGAELEQIMKIWQEHQDSGYVESEERDTIAAALSNSMLTHLEEGNQISKKYEQRYKDFRLHVDILKTLSPDAKPEIDNLFSKVRSEMDKRKKARDKLEARRADFRASVESQE